MKDLIEKLEQATGPSYALDQEIKLAHAAVLITAGVNREMVIAATAGNLYDAPRAYTGTYDGAMALKPNGVTFALGDMNADGVAWACLTDSEGHDYAATGATPILALCAASLKALSAAGKPESGRA